MIWRSVKRRFRKGCTSSRVDGPPIFIITIAVGGFEAVVAKDRRIAVATDALDEPNRNIVSSKKTLTQRYNEYASYNIRKFSSCPRKRW